MQAQSGHEFFHRQQRVFIADDEQHQGWSAVEMMLQVPQARHRQLLAQVRTHEAVAIMRPNLQGNRGQHRRVAPAPGLGLQPAALIQPNEILPSNAPRAHPISHLVSRTPCE